MSAVEAAPALTPTLRQGARRAVFWVIAGVAVLIVGALITAINGGASGGVPYGAGNAGPAGSRAVVEVLRGQGVEVTTADTLAAVRAAAGDGEDVTLFVADVNGILDAGAVAQLPGLAASLVVADPGFAALQAIAPGVAHGGAPARSTAEAGCDVAAAQRAGSIRTGGSSLTADDAWTGCFPTGGDGFALVRGAHGATAVTLVADGAVFSNDGVAQDGAAALALGLLGEHRTLVWYLPGLGDVVGGSAATPAELTPAWVTPVLVLGIVVFVAAAVWRGRRLGALVAEDLPVTVRASETMDGRARLYARTDARLRAADAVRVGAIGRIAGQLGLPRTANVDEVVAAAAAVTRLAPDEVYASLIGGIPRSDRELMTLSQRIDDLERRVHDAVRPTPPASGTAPSTGGS